MAKKKGGGAILDQLPNRHYEVVTMAAAATTAVANTFETMMSARQQAGWLISRIDVRPRGLLATLPPVQQHARFQIATGAQVALLNPDDDNVIATLDYSTVLVGAAAAMHDHWPLTWLGPVAVSSKEITCMIDCAADAAPFQSTAWLFTIWFNWLKIGLKELLEIREAQGVL